MMGISSVIFMTALCTSQMTPMNPYNGSSSASNSSHMHSHTWYVFVDSTEPLVLTAPRSRHVTAIQPSGRSPGRGSSFATLSEFCKSERLPLALSVSQLNSSFSGADSMTASQGLELVVRRGSMRGRLAADFGEGSHLARGFAELEVMAFGFDVHRVAQDRFDRGLAAARAQWGA